jgi:hypothetical protein
MLDLENKIATGTIMAITKPITRTLLIEQTKRILVENEIYIQYCEKKYWHTMEWGHEFSMKWSGNMIFHLKS